MNGRLQPRNGFILPALLHRVLVFGGAAFLTLSFFLVLPLMQSLQKPLDSDLALQTMDTAQLEPPPPPPPEEEPEEEEQEEEQPPELADEAPPLDLSQLELALNPGFGEGWLEGDFAINLNAMTSGSDDVDALFSISELDQKPRVIYQPSPTLTDAIRRKAPGTVYIVFIVDQQGRVQKPIIERSSDSVFDKAAMSAVKQWKFEPGKRNGKPVRFRMRVPITFPKG